MNAQEQQKFVWPPSFALARAYLDQLERSKGLAADDDRVGPDGAGECREAAPAGSGRRRSRELASQLNGAAGAASDQMKVRTLSTSVTDLANATR